MEDLPIYDTGRQYSAITVLLQFKHPPITVCNIKKMDDGTLQIFKKLAIGYRLISIDVDGDVILVRIQGPELGYSTKIIPFEFLKTSKEEICNFIDAD